MTSAATGYQDKPLRKQFTLFWGVAAQFSYVGAQPGIAGYFYCYETQPHYLLYIPQRDKEKVVSLSSYVYKEVDSVGRIIIPSNSKILLTTIRKPGPTSPLFQHSTKEQTSMPSHKASSPSVDSRPLA